MSAYDSVFCALRRAFMSYTVHIVYMLCYDGDDLTTIHEKQKTIKLTFLSFSIRGKKWVLSSCALALLMIG